MPAIPPKPKPVPKGSSGAIRQPGQAFKPKPPPQPPNTVAIPDPLADPTYKYQSRDLGQQLSDYKSAQTLAGNQYNTNYTDQLYDMGYNATKNVWDMSRTNPGTYGRVHNDNVSDFASRGIGRSGDYLKSSADLSNVWGDRVKDLRTAKTQFGQTQQNELQGYTNLNQQALENAKREAIARIVAKYGIQASQVTPGHTNYIPKT